MEEENFNKSKLKKKRVFPGPAGGGRSCDPFDNLGWRTMLEDFRVIDEDPTSKVFQSRDLHDLRLQPFTLMSAPKGIVSSDDCGCSCLDFIRDRLQKPLFFGVVVKVTNADNRRGARLILRDRTGAVEVALEKGTEAHFGGRQFEVGDAVLLQDYRAIRGKGFKTYMDLTINNLRRLYTRDGIEVMKKAIGTRSKEVISLEDEAIPGKRSPVELVELEESGAGPSTSVGQAHVGEMASVPAAEEDDLLSGIDDDELFAAF